MYMCDLIASISFELCLGLVVFAGVQSLAYNYTIRQRDFNSSYTFCNTNCLWVWAVATL